MLLTWFCVFYFPSKAICNIHTIYFLDLSVFKNYIFPLDDTINTNPYTDTIRLNIADTLPIPTEKKKDNNTQKMNLDYPVYYNATDSIIIDFANQKAYLYGKAVLIYESVNLTSEFMSLDFNNNEVYAHGITGADGKIIGKPEFKDGDETFVADTIRYNFKSKKGIIKNVITEFEGSFLHGDKTKLQPNKHVHIIDGKFTTCDLEHPHYYFKISKAIVIPDDKIVSGPAYLVIEDIPTPLGIPFGFFPNKKGGTSGVIIPEFGDEDNRGFFLRNGGYYWAISEKADLTILGDIYSKGSWGLGFMSNYKVRYKYSGRLDFKYNKNVFGVRDINQTKDDMYAFRWKFNQDPKAWPNANFTADVNISSAKFDRYNSYSANNYMSTNKQSSISFTKSFPNSPFNMTLALRQTQNNATHKIDLTLPDFNLNMNRIYPLKRRVQVGQSKFYEKIGVSYTMNATNRISTTDTAFFALGFQNFTNGFNHRIPVTTSLKFLKYTTIAPSFTYTERWYFKALNKFWDYDQNDIIYDYYTKFSRVYDYNFSVNWSTQLFGTFNYKKGRIKAIRHIVNPSISYSYLPDFGKEKYNYHDSFSRIVYNANTGQYDTLSYIYARFEGLPYGVPARGGAGSINLNLGNNLEMKLRNTNDTINPDRKVKILESLNFSTSYNIFADSLNWSPVNVNGRTKIKFLDLNFNATLDPYMVVPNLTGTSGIRINRFLVSETGQLFRLTTSNLAIGFSLNSHKAEQKNTQTEQYSVLYGFPDNYVDFDIPWNFRINYNLRYAKPYFESNITQTLNFSGDFSLTKKWKISFTSGYDFVKKTATYTTIDIYRDLHCWEASLHMIPFGQHKAYMFQINVKAQMLKDLKLAKRRSWFDNL